MIAMGEGNHQIAREKMAILRILANSPKAIGSNVIARMLREGYGITLSERAIRYHLRLMDEMGLTTKISRRSGRILTLSGKEELDNAMVADKVGFVIDKIELLAYQTTFDPAKKTGLIPINLSLFPEVHFKSALKAMSPVFKSGMCISDMIAIIPPGKRLGGIIVPDAYIGLATVCSIVINGVLLKEGIPMDSRFGGLLQMQHGKPWRFAELIQYSGSSLDPSEIFISGRMTSVNRTIKNGDGKILANFREIPSASLGLAQKIINKLSKAGINSPLMLGEPSYPVCEIPVGLNKVGMVLIGGLNPVAAVVESGINITSKAMSSVIDYRELQSFWEI
jgi:repressor of nif and glnA expression